MSSEVESGGSIAAAVALPVAVAFGAGWLAWQAGKQTVNLVRQAGDLLADANDAVDREIQAKQRQRQEMERHRRLTAQTSRRHLTAVCNSVLAELDADGGDSAAVEPLRKELMQIQSKALPEDTAGLELQNAADLARLDWIVSRQERLRELKVVTADGLTVARLMKDLRLAAAAELCHTRGENVQAADPLVLERAELNLRLSELSARVRTALEFVADMAENYGMSDANNAWFQSCFNGVDQRIQTMCSPTVSNAELKKSLRSLEDVMAQYDLLYPTLSREKQNMSALYPVYMDGARALGEPVLPLSEFKEAAALEKALQAQKTRAQRAGQCAQIYQKLGPAAYLCYAWDEELRAMGYTVHTRKQITDLIRLRPERARLRGMELPFYQWGQESLTQLYQITPECDLQLIVHPDGTTTMQTMAVQSAERSHQAIAAQRSYCSRIQELHRRLKENWFILYDYRETAPADRLLSVNQWLSDGDNAWAQPAGVRENIRSGEQKAMHKE